MRWISSLILVFFLFAVHRPNTPHRMAPASALQGDTKNAQEFPVIYGKKNDGFPDKVSTLGMIAKVSFAPDCGLVHGGGVLQIKLARSAPGYDPEHIYVVAPC